MIKGLLIAIEGVDGTGKYTQSSALREHLERQGFRTSFYSYPDYSSEHGRKIDAYLNHKIEMPVTELFEEYLEDMLKDKEKVENDLKAGKIVIIDRYFMSTIAYQSAQGYGYQKAKHREDDTGLPRPDIIVYFEMPLYISVERKEKQRAAVNRKKDRFEGNEQIQKGAGYYYNKMVNEGYPNKHWLQILGEGDRNVVHRRVVDAVEPFVSKMRVRYTKLIG